MNEITLAAWIIALQQRDMTFLGLFFFAATGLFCWRLWLVGQRLGQRLVAALAAVAYLALLVVGVVQLWQL